MTEARNALSEAHRRLSSLLSDIASPPSELEVWQVYVAVEISVVKIKMALGEDRMGRFVDRKQLYKTENRDLLTQALSLLERALGEVESGELSSGLADLRESRNRLRAFLVKVKKERLKAKRG